MKQLLKGGRVVDPANGLDGTFDVLIDAGRIARVGRDLPADGARIVEIPAGLVICPGLIDMHVHLREPGQEHRKRSPPASPPPSPAASPRSPACPTPSR